MRSQFLTFGALLGLCLLGLNGCRQETAGSVQGSPGHPHVHSHDEPGPHNGSVIEIGAKDHHAEVVHDEAAHKVGVHILEGDAKTTVPIEAKSVLIHITADGDSKEYELPAAPQSGEGEGKSSYYELVDEELSETIAGHTDSKSVVARLIIQVGERPFEGFIGVESAHDHEGEDSHEEADAHEDDAAKAEGETEAKAEGEAEDTPVDEAKQEDAAPGEGSPVTEGADSATDGESAAPEGEAGAPEGEGAATEGESATTETAETTEDSAKATP